ncbi:hypothetical protein QTG56_07905 [Rossellomorea sp. AcN35-11]|nr:hypothetical protein [Rossellomorea aquimaris]WJV30904.1 hypothetical protein QTG56_07905 [Rossellomorea sp. AcN35-11]
MNDLREERGYALVTVLLMMVVFMVISLSFMGHSFSSVKQNSEVEKDYQSVALAEMGAEYFEGKVKNVLRGSGLSGITSIEELKNRVRASLENGEGIQEVSTAASFQIPMNNLTIDVTSDKSQLLITFDSVGSSEGKQTTLHTTMKIPIKIGLNPSKKLPEFNLIKQPVNVPAQCKNPAVIYDSCLSILVLGSASYSQNHNDLNNKLIYSTGALSLDGNANNMSRTSIHTDGSMNIGKNMNNAENVTLEVKGAFTSGGQLRLEKSQVYVAGSMSVAGHMDVEGNSHTYVGGDAYISKHLSISSDSKMCVAGNLEASQINIDGKLYVKGSVSGKIKTGQPTYVNDTDFVKNCGVSGSAQGITFMLDGLVSEVDY